MRKFHLLTVFQYAIVLALIIIGATTMFALKQNNQALSRVPGDGASEVLAVGASELSDAEQAGRNLWNANGCGACHAKSMVDDATGPALAGVTDRWAAEPRAHLYEWVRNSQKLIASGSSERAVAVWEENNKAVMSGYAHLQDTDIDALLAYIER